MQNAPRVVLYDTLLRDGSQMEGVAFSLEDKIAVARKLDELGISYIEGGFPGSNEKDRLFFQRIKEVPLRQAKIVAFGGTRKAGADVKTDPNIQSLVDAGTDVVTLVGKASAYQVRVALETSAEENLAMIADTVQYFKALGKEVCFDAEHFFDGYSDTPAYALQAVRTAARAGADALVLCDTNGGASTRALVEAIEAVKAALPEATLGIHVHDDAGLAVANSLAAVEHGVGQVQGCLNGYGERCGNANLTTLIPNLQIKLGIPVVDDAQLARLTEVSQFIAELANLPLNPQAPYVGLSAFAHKAGLPRRGGRERCEHLSAHPAAAGWERPARPDQRTLRAAQHRLQTAGARPGFPPHPGGDPRPSRAGQAHGEPGFQYEGAEASFELLALRLRPGYQRPFELEDFMVVERRRHRPADGGDGENEMLAEAMAKVAVGGRVYQTAADGNGPVNALDGAVRKGLREPYPAIERVRLLDYKVRILDTRAGTGAGVRVLIESTDGERIWTTVGSSTDVIEASWIALSDAYEYFLVKQPEWAASR